MATENNPSSPSAIPEQFPFSRTNFEPSIQRETSSPSPARPSEIESDASSSTIITMTPPGSRPATRDPSYEVPLQLQSSSSRGGSSIIDHTRTENQTLQTSERRTVSMPHGDNSELNPQPFIVMAPVATASVPSMALQTPSSSSNKNAEAASNSYLPLRDSRNSSKQKSVVLMASDDDSESFSSPNEETPLVVRAHDTNPSSFQLPAYLQCDLFSNLFSWIYESAAEFIDSLRWVNFTRPFDDTLDNDIVRSTILLMWVNTFVGMIAQGLLGGLNAEDFVTTHIKDAIVVSVSALIIFSIAAMEGKRRLVGMFNQMAAERLPERITEFPAKVTRYDIALSIATWPVKIVISSVFSVLAEVSLSAKYGAASVLLKYQKPWANNIAAFLTSVPVTTIAMFSALTINLIGFPTKFALLTVLTSLDQAMQTSAYKKQQAEVQRYIDALLLHVITLFEANRHDDIKLLMEQINDPAQDDVLERIIATVKARDIPLPEPESWLQFFKRQIPALIAFAISVYGISNFYAIAENFLIPYLQLPESFGPPAGAMAMTGMTALCFMAVYVPLISNEHELPILSRREKAWNWACTFTMCGLGALTNLQQAIMTNTLTDPTAIAFSYSSAFLSPVLIEAKGYYKYTTTPMIKQRIANDATGNLGRANKAVEFFQKQRNAVANLSEETLHTHYDKAVGRESNPAERPSKYIHTYFFKSIKRQPLSAGAIENQFVLMERGQAQAPSVNYSL